MRVAFESADDDDDTGQVYVLDLSFNNFYGSVPKFATDLLTLDVVGNFLKNITSACEQVRWNDGATLKLGCDGFACPPGTSNAEGRQTSQEDLCKECKETPYYGTVGCRINGQGSGLHQEEHEAGHAGGLLNTDIITSIPAARPTHTSSVVGSDRNTTGPYSSAKPSSAPSVQTLLPTAEMTIVGTDIIS